jgi:hypothetical protein
MAKNEFFFTTTTTHDLPFMWAAYKNGDLLKTSPHFDPALKLNFEDFTTVFLDYLNTFGLICFTMFHDKGENTITPIGFAATWIRGRIVEIGDLVWFHWSSPRNILEAAINFYGTFRTTLHEPSGKTYKVLEFAQKKDEKFFDILVRKGILSRVGEFSDLYEKEDCVLFTTTKYEVKREKVA